MVLCLNYREPEQSQAAIYDGTLSKEEFPKLYESDWVLPFGGFDLIQKPRGSKFFFFVFEGNNCSFKKGLSMSSA